MSSIEEQAKCGRHRVKGKLNKVTLAAILEDSQRTRTEKAEQLATIKQELAEIKSMLPKGMNTVTDVELCRKGRESAKFLKSEN